MLKRLTKLLENSARKEKPSSVACSPVLESEAARKTELGQLLGMGLHQDVIALDGGGRNLAQAEAIGDTNNHSVLRRTVQTHDQFQARYCQGEHCLLELGLVLGDQPLASTEVGLASTPAAILGLVPLKVRIVLDELHEGHGEKWDRECREVCPALVPKQDCRFFF